MQSVDAKATRTDPADSAGSRTMHDPFEGTLVYELRRASGALAGLMAQLFGELALKPSEAMLLMAIANNPGCTQSDLARMHRSKPANLVPLIARLEREDLVARTPGKGRVIGLTVSSRGEVVLEEVRSRFERIEANLARQLDGDALSALVRGLQLACMNACHFERPLHGKAEGCSSDDEARRE